jgi:chromate transporter
LSFSVGFERRSKLTSQTDTTQVRRPVGRRDLFLGFLKIGLIGFGGVAPWARRIIVEERGWLTEQEYISILAIGQVLPGANTVNAAVMIGDRFQGPVGACLSLLALMVMPLSILIVLASLYGHFSALPDVRAALQGSASAAAGLVIGTVAKMAINLRLGAVSILFSLFAFLAVVWLQVSLVPLLVVLVPLSMIAAARSHPK